MGWTVYYAVTAKSGRPAAELEATANTCLERFRLSRRSEPFQLRVNGGDLRGFTKVQYAATPEEDFVTIVRGLQKLATDHPEVTVLVSDDLYIDAPTDVLTVGSPREILKPKNPSRITAVPVLTSTPAASPELIARRFLDSAHLRARIEVGESFPSPELVKRLTLLGELMQERKKPRKGTIFDMLETSPCIEEVYASDAELDSLWQRAVEGTLE